MKPPPKRWICALNPALWSPSCWCPSYVKNRIETAWFCRRNPDAPWITKDAVKFLSDYLKSSDRVAEFGSGRSTRFFARRCASVLSFEHNPEWHQCVETSLAAEGMTNVDYRLRLNASYYEDITNEPDNSFDIALIDGVFRGDCALNALPKLRKGGLIL